VSTLHIVVILGASAVGFMVIRNLWEQM